MDRLPGVASPPPEPWLRKRCFDLGVERRGPLSVLAWTVFRALLVLQSPRARGRRGRALLAWARAQLARRADRWLEVEVGGTVIVCPPSSAMAPLLAACGTHEPVEDALVHAVTDPGDEVLDAGAHIGSFGLLLTGRRVTFVEPDPVVAAILRHNVERNLGRVEGCVVEAAVGASPGRASFTTDRDVQNQLVPDGSPGSVEVRVTTIDELSESTGARWQVLKLDLEGFDLEGLMGAARTIEADRPLILVETVKGGHEIRSLLASWNYEVCWYDWRHQQLVRFPDGWAGNFTFHTNMLAVPNERLGDTARRVAAFRPLEHFRADPPVARPVAPPELG